MKIRPVPIQYMGMKQILNFWKKVQKTDTCWVWTGSRDGKDYGMSGVHGAVYRAHRVSYELAHGFSDSSLVVDHLCRNPQCVNPAHLELVTNRTNCVVRGVGPIAVNAAKRLCHKGHEFRTVESGDRRRCRECDRASAKNRYWRDKEEVK